MQLSICIAALLGTLAGLGVGGGSILLLWLTLVVKIPVEDARLINLMFFIPAASIVGFKAVKENHIEIKKLLPAAVVGCICAFLFSKVSENLPIPLLKKLFGIILLLTGFREIVYRPRNAR